MHQVCRHRHRRAPARGPLRGPLRQLHQERRPGSEPGQQHRDRPQGFPHRGHHRARFRQRRDDDPLLVRHALPERLHGLHGPRRGRRTLLPAPQEHSEVHLLHLRPQERLPLLEVLQDHLGHQPYQLGPQKALRLQAQGRFRGLSGRILRPEQYRGDHVQRVPRRYVHHQPRRVRPEVPHRGHRHLLLAEGPQALQDHGLQHRQVHPRRQGPADLRQPQRQHRREHQYEPQQGRPVPHAFQVPGRRRERVQPRQRLP